MPSIVLESLVILLLILANGVFSGAEIAVVSSRKIRLQHLADKGNRQAQMALRLVNAPNDFLSTVQIGITLIGVLSGAVAGATIAQRLQPLLQRLPPLRSWSEGLSVAIVVTIITYLSLVIGELVPKRIALNAPEQIACSVARPMQWLSRLAAPLVHLLGMSTDALLRLLGVRASTEPGLTEEEIRALVRQGAEAGVLEPSEHQMLQRVFRLGDRSIRAIMTPRTEISWLDSESPLQASIGTVIQSNHSRFPVGRGSLDDCLGIVRGSSLLAAQLSGSAVRLEDLIQPPLVVTEGDRALNVIEQFRTTGIHIALVTDEYGGIEGLLTLNDLMEAIVGDLPSAEELEEPLIIRREDGSWLLDGSLDIGDFKELVRRGPLPQEAEGIFHTLGGFVMHHLGRIPRTGEQFQWEGLRLEVVDMDGKRVDKVLVSLPAQAPSPAGEDPP